MKTFIAFAAFVAAIAASGPPAYAPAPTYHATPAYHAAPVYPDVAPAYNYVYAAADDYSGVNFGQSESRDGYATSGSYNVALPDGRIQTVTYRVDGDSGYIADVQYSGEAKYAPYKPAPAPAYKPAPAPVYHAAPAPAYKPAP